MPVKNLPRANLSRISSSSSSVLIVVGQGRTTLSKDVNMIQIPHFIENRRVNKTSARFVRFS
jgi:hypothetical protein